MRSRPCRMRAIRVPKSIATPRSPGLFRHYHAHLARAAPPPPDAVSERLWRASVEDPEHALAEPAGKENRRREEGRDGEAATVAGGQERRRAGDGRV